LAKVKQVKQMKQAPPLKNQHRISLRGVRCIGIDSLEIL